MIDPTDDLLAEAEAMKPAPWRRCATCAFIASRPEDERPKWRRLIANTGITDQIKVQMVAKRGVTLSSGAIGNCRRGGHS